MADDPIWTNDSHPKCRGLVGLTPLQSNIEFFSTKYYNNLKKYIELLN